MGISINLGSPYEAVLFSVYCIAAIAFFAFLIKAVDLSYKYYKTVFSVAFNRVLFTNGKLKGLTAYSLCILRLHNKTLTNSVIPLFPLGYSVARAQEALEYRERIMKVNELVPESSTRQ